MKQRITLLMLVLITTFASCNKESELDTSKIAAGKIAAEFTTQIQTRAAGNSWSANDEIGVFMINEGKDLSIASIVNGGDNIPYRTATGGTKGTFSVVQESQKIYFPTNGNVDFVSYYPFKPNVDGYCYTVDIYNQSNQEAIDLLYSNNAKGMNSSGGPVAFHFEHKLSKLMIKISSDDYTAEELATAVVTIKEINTWASFSLPLDSILVRGKVSDITAKTVTAGKTYEAIVIPDVLKMAPVIEFTIAGKKLSWNITTAAFRPGNRYNYNLVLKRDYVVIDDSSIDDWEDNVETEKEQVEIQEIRVSNMLIKNSFDSKIGKINEIKFWEIDPLTGYDVPDGFRKMITFDYSVAGVAKIEGTIPNPAAISYSGKEREALNFTAQYKLNGEGLASSGMITKLDTSGKVIEKYMMEYQYNTDRQLVLVVKKDTAGTKIAETKATWNAGNLESCEMGYYIKTILPDTTKPDTTKPDSARFFSKASAMVWETITEAYTYDARVNKKGILLPLIIPAPYYSENVIGVFEALSGLLGKAPKNYVARSIDSDGYEKNIIYVFGEGVYAPYPSEATIHGDGVQKLSFIHQRFLTTPN